VVVQREELRPVRDAERLQQRWVVRVSSAATTVACSSAATSRAEASPRFPMGVAAEDDHRPSIGWWP
jgi:hypothetical protein